MAQLVLGVAGAAVGFMVGGPQGAAYGWMVGVGVGSAFAPKQRYEAPQIEDLRLPRVDLGQPVTWVAGSPVVTGNVIYASSKRPIKHTEESGGKGGGGAESSYWTYEIDLYIKLTENPIAGVSRAWKNGDLVYGDGVTRNGIWAEMRVYTGEEGQLPDPDFEAALGAEKAQAHLGCGAVFIKSLQLDSGGNMPVLKFEVGWLNSFVNSNAELITHLRFDGAVTEVDSGVEYLRFPDDSGYGKIYFNGGSYPDPYKNQYIDAVIKKYGEGSLGADGVDIITGPSEDSDFSFIDSGSFAFWYYQDELNSTIGKNIVFYRISLSNSYGDVIISVRQNYEGSNGVLRFELGENVFEVGSSGSILGRFVYCYCGFQDGVAYLQFDGSFSSYAITLRYTPPESHAVYIGGVGGNWHHVDDLIVFKGGAIYKQPFGDPSGPWGAVTSSPLMNVVGALLLRSGYDSYQFDVTALASITKPVRGLAIGRLTNTRSVLELLAQTHWFTWQKRGFQIVFLPRVEDVAASIPFDDLGVSTGATSDRTPLEFQFASELELPAQVSVTYPNVLNDYQPDAQLSDHFLSQQQSVENIELAVGMTPTEAKAVADAIQIERLAAMGKTTVTVPLKWLKIEPNDVVNLYDQDGREYRVRVGDVKDHGLYLEWDVVLDDVRATLSAGITDGGNTGQSTVQQMALTEWLPLDMPLIRDADNNPGWWVAAAPGVGDLWPGAAVMGSWDGVSFSKLADTTDAAVFGETTTVLGDWTGGNVFDTTNSVTVSINGEASSYTRAAMLADLSLGVWLIGSEVIRARTATLVSAGVYRLSNLIRGFRGTAWAMGTHAVGERAVLINSALRRVATQQSHIGLERQIKAITAGLAQTTATAEAFTDTGIALKPFAPVNLKGAWDVGTGDLALTWRRHPRLSHRFLAPGIEPPLGETSELYDVEIWDTGFTTLKHTFSSVSARSQTYTAAQQTADFGAPQSSVGVRVYQRSEAVGRGYKLQGVV